MPTNFTVKGQTTESGQEEKKKKSVMKGKWCMFQTILENTFKMSLTFAMQFIQQKVIHIYEALN